MKGGVLILIALLLILISLAIAAFSLVRNRVRRHHRVDPTVPSGAPLSWTFDPRLPARLHRRLTRIGTATTRIISETQPRRGLRRRRPDPTPAQQLATELRLQAVQLDRRLEQLDALAPALRREPLAELDRGVTELERATTRLITLQHELDHPVDLTGRPDPIEEAGERVDLLARAHEELRRLDRDHGIDHRSRPPTEPSTPDDPAAGSASPDPGPDSR